MNKLSAHTKKLVLFFAEEEVIEDVALVVGVAVIGFFLGWW